MGFCPIVFTLNIGWTASATIELQNSLGESEPLVRDYDEKRLANREKIPNGKTHRVMRIQPPLPAFPSRGQAKLINRVTVSR